MRNSRPWWRARRVMHRDAVALCILSSSFLLAGELASPVLLENYNLYLANRIGEPAAFALYSILFVLAFTTAFGGILVIAGGWFFMRGKVSRGRFLVGLGVGLTALTFASRLATYTLNGAPADFFLVPLATTPLTFIGILVGTIAHTAMGQYALFLKRHAWEVWRRWRRAHPRREDYTLRPFNGTAFSAHEARRAKGRRA